MQKEQKKLKKKMH